MGQHSWGCSELWGWGTEGCGRRAGNGPGERDGLFNLKGSMILSRYASALLGISHTGTGMNFEWMKVA